MKRDETAYNYIITSGWWCGEVPDEIRKRQGSEKTRQVGFFDKWKKSIEECTKPAKIMILDSASTEKPTLEQLEGVEFLSILSNPGHSTKHNGKYCGYTRSIIMGVTYAALCDADYWVYVEQDALLKGEGIIEHCINQMKTPYMFGSGEGTPQFLQQSLCIIRKDGFEPFLNNMNSIDATDTEISPETKFLLATSVVYRLIPTWLVKQITQNSNIGKVVRKIIHKSSPYLKGFDFLPVGYGRKRPIDFDEEFIYFQHGSEEELEKFEKITCQNCS